MKKLSDNCYRCKVNPAVAAYFLGVFNSLNYCARVSHNFELDNMIESTAF